MIKKLIIFFVAFLVFHSTIAQINFESIHQFWNVVDKLQESQPVSAEDWKGLFNTPGYRLYITENGVDSATLVLFKSNMIKACQSKVNSTHEEAEDRWLKNLKRTIRLKNELKTHERWLQSVAYLDSMQAGAHAYLPERIKKASYPSPATYFLIFDYDGSANVKGIFMDLLLSYDVDKPKAGAFGGHELHHYIVDQYLKDKKFPQIASQEKGIHWAIQVTATEGIANLVDKKYVLSAQSAYQDKDWFMGMVAKGPAIVADMNKNIEALPESTDGVLTTVSHWQKVLRGNGHFLGYYMAQIIEKAGLGKKLIEQVDNPFYFFYLYNQATRNSKADVPVFSEKSLNYIKRLEQKYKTS